jgi:hypothetical protein
MCSSEGEPHQPSVVEQYADLFVQRDDAWSRQRERSRLYTHVKSPLTDDILRRHLTGDITVGLHSIQQDGTSRWSVIDSDEGLWPVYDIKQQLQAKGISSYVEQSRAGGHLWTWWREPQDPRYLRKILSPYARGREVFPAGDIPDEDGYGLVIRGPLGVHRATGQRYPFLDDNAKRVSPGEVRGQLEWLGEHVVTNDPELLGPKATFEREERLRQAGIVYESPIRAWCESVDGRAIVEQYVRLNRRGVGRCPWPAHHNHADRHPSFQFFEKTGRWFCYASREGGNVADLAMRMEKLTPVDFIKRYCQAPRVGLPAMIP